MNDSLFIIGGGDTGLKNISNKKLDLSDEEKEEISYRASVNKLPDDVCHLILSFLNKKDLCKLPIVSSKFKLGNCSEGWFIFLF